MTIYSYVSGGFDGDLVTVEVDLRRGIPGMDVVGLPDNAVREARERVRAAVRNSGFHVPRERILINLAPAGVKKAGASFDLPIAAALLLADGQIQAETGLRILIIGELELSGTLRPVNGVLAAVASAVQAGIDFYLVPRENAYEAFTVGADKVLTIGHLREISRIFSLLIHRRRDLLVNEVRGDENGKNLLMNNAGGDEHGLDLLVNEVRGDENGRDENPGSQGNDYADILGQGHLKRACEIAAAGRHHMLLFGPPGVGKTMAAMRFMSILPPLRREEAIEVTRIYSIGGMLPKGSGLIRYPPLRAPHHTASREGLIGGGSQIQPGEISYAHRGVLFLDEAFEFSFNLLQSLREPLERGIVEIARSGMHYWFPARFQLIMAVNPCPCGKLGKPGAVCMCTPIEIHRYWKKLGAALLDRIDLRVPVEHQGPILDNRKKVSSSRDMSERIERAIAAQDERCKQHGLRNADMATAELKRCCPLSAKAADGLRKAVEQIGLSTRAEYSVIKIARTIADLDGSEVILPDHLLEAVHFRRYTEGDYFWNAA